MSTQSVITLGPSGKPLDYRAWDAHCLARLGRVPPRWLRLSSEDWARLGYPAAGMAGIRKPTEKELVG